MCQAKPGLRCSGHSREKVAHLEDKMKEVYNDPNSTQKDKAKAKSTLGRAKVEYFSTKEGKKEMNRQIDEAEEKEVDPNKLRAMKSVRGQAERCRKNRMRMTKYLNTMNQNISEECERREEEEYTNCKMNFSTKSREETQQSLDRIKQDNQNIIADSNKAIKEETGEADSLVHNPMAGISQVEGLAYDISISRKIKKLSQSSLAGAKRYAEDNGFKW